MKSCRACGKEKSESEFNWRNKAKGKRCPSCRECMRKYIQNHYYNNVEYYIEKAVRRKKAYIRATYKKILDYLLVNPCLDCGETDPVVLEFDHVDNQIKLAAVSEMVKQQRPWRIIFEEIQKCEVRCANCHMRKTAKQRNYGIYLLLQESSIASLE
jgi:hypothetical protein